MGLAVLQQIKQEKITDVRLNEIKLQQQTGQKQYLHRLIFKTHDNQKRNNIKNNRVVRQLNLNKQAATTEIVRVKHVIKQNWTKNA